MVSRELLLQAFSSLKGVKWLLDFSSKIWGFNANFERFLQKAFAFRADGFSYGVKSSLFVESNRMGNIRHSLGFRMSSFFLASQLLL